MLDLKYIAFHYNLDRTKIYGFIVQISAPTKHKDIKPIAKCFYDSQYENALMAALDYRDNDPECQKLIKLKNDPETKKRGSIKEILLSTPDKAADYVKKRYDKAMEKYNIKKFPFITSEGSKFIGLDIVNYKELYFIRECKNCHSHQNIRPGSLLTDKGYCKECSLHNKNSYFYTTTNRQTITCKGIISTYPDNKKQRDIIAVSVLVRKDQPDLIEKYKIYIRYIFDMIIRKFELKYKRTYQDDELKGIKKQIDSFNIPEPSIRIDLDYIENDASIRKQTHVFKANLAGFGSHKYDPSLKMVLLNKVEYVGIDNFRDHMWTPFSTELDLPPGTQIKFKGEIYDYEKGYQGKNPDGKISQAIKIIKMLEVIPPINNK